MRLRELSLPADHEAEGKRGRVWAFVFCFRCRVVFFPVAEVLYSFFFVFFLSFFLQSLRHCLFLLRSVFARRKQVGDCEAMTPLWSFLFACSLSVPHLDPLGCSLSLSFLFCPGGFLLLDILVRVEVDLSCVLDAS